MAMTLMSRMMTPSPEAPMISLLATQPVTRAVRQLASGYLEDAAAACRQLKDPANAEALHDFRVALRRLRSLIRAYRPYIRDCLPKKLRRRVKDLASDTGIARDTEVQLAWLKDQRGQARSHERPGYMWIIRRLEARLDEEYQDIREHLPGRFERLQKRITTRLALDYDDSAPPLGEVAAELLLQTGEELRAHLERVHGQADEEEIHQARITAKRLRYLLEPLVPELENGKELVKELKSLQGIMGEIHDTQVLGAELSQAAEEAGAARMKQLIDLSLRLPHDDPQVEAARRSDERPGLVSLARDLQEREQDLINRLLGSMGEGDLSRFLEHLQTAVDELRVRVAPVSESDAEANAEPDADTDPGA
jgi:CHAD domain-containing protein